MPTYDTNDEENEKVEIKYGEASVRPSYGGQTVELTYVLTHKKYGRKNQYVVKASLRGLESGDVYLSGDSAVFIGGEEDTNDETLIEQAVLGLFEDKVG